MAKRRRRGCAPDLETVLAQLHSADEQDGVRALRANRFPGAGGLPKCATFDLSVGEARYLRERIIVSHRDSLLAFLAGECDPADVDFAWEHPQRSLFREPFSEQLAHARPFSEGMHGAQLLYNLLLAEAAGNDEWAGSFATAMAD